MLGPAVGCLGTASLPVDLAPSFSIPPFEPGCALIPAPATFFSPLIPFCSSCTSPSLRLRCTTIIFLLSFSFFTTSAYRIGLSLFQGNPSHSFFLLLTVPLSFTTLFSRTLFGNLLDSSFVLENRLYIHSFCSSGQPKFYHTTRNKNPTNLRHRSARRSLASLHPIPNNPQLLVIPTPSTSYLATCPRRALCSRIQPGPLRKYAGR